jgi:hypothetical protein
MWALKQITQERYAADKDAAPVASTKSSGRARLRRWLIDDVTTVARTSPPPADGFTNRFAGYVWPERTARNSAVFAFRNKDPKRSATLARLRRPTATGKRRCRNECS